MVLVSLCGFFSWLPRLLLFGERLDISQPVGGGDFLCVGFSFH